MSNYLSPLRSLLIAVMLLLAVLLTGLVASSFGAVDIAMADVLTAICAEVTGHCQLGGFKQQIIIDLRLPRVLLAFIAGAGLALSGAVLQAVTRNPLADPYLFGISSGASFGAVLFLTVFSGTTLLTLPFGPIFSLPVGAFLGSSLAVVLVLSIAGNQAVHQVERMLLAGVATSFMFSAATSGLLYQAEPQAAASILFWTLGSFARAQWTTLGFPALLICGCLVLFVGFKRHISAISAGDESAHTLGVSVAKLRLGMLLLSSLITATLVAYCGGIAFVGLMVPHLVRLVFANTGLNNFLVVSLVGGLFMIAVDLLARTLLENQEVPVGIITSAIGSVFFLMILRRRNQRRGG